MPEKAHHPSSDPAEASVPGIENLTSLAQSSRTHNRNRLGGLDGLRAIAVLIVILSHLQHTLGWTLAGKFSRYVSGVMGVNVFFVLSGYLITWLILAEIRRASSFSFKTFYVRRFFRILPPAMLYLGCIGVLTAVGVYHVALGDFAASLFSVRNVFDSPPFSHGYYSDQTSHYWSLSLEEQFYLFWPLLLVACPRRALPWLIWFLLPFSIVMAAVKAHSSLNWVLTAPAYLHNFGPILIGCQLALLRDRAVGVRAGWTGGARGGGGELSGGSTAGRLALNPWIVVLAVAASVGVAAVPHNSLYAGMFQAGCFAVLVNYLVSSEQSVATRILELPPVRYVGRLSYSLYLWQQIFCWADPALPRNWWEKFPLSIVLAFAAAALSHHLVELPVLRLRDRVWKS